VSGSVRRAGDSWYLATRIDTTERDRRQLKRAGFATRREATAALGEIDALLRLAGDDDRLRRRLGDLVVQRSRHGGALPSVEEVRRRLGAGLDPLSPGTTLAEWLDDWLAANRRIRPGTRASYVAQVERFLKPVIGDVPLARVGASHVADVLDWIELRNGQIVAAREVGTKIPDDPREVRTLVRVLGPASQRLTITVLSMALKEAVRRGLIVRNPCEAIRLPELERKPARTWDPAQVVRFVEATADDRYALLFRLILLRGLRRGEACGLRWSDVEDDGRALTINRTMHRDGATGDPKTKTSRRTISLDSQTAELLRRYRRAQLQERLVAGPAWRDQDWIFCRPDGSHVPPAWLLKRFRELAESAGLPPIKLHEGRHTAATLGLESDVPLKVVSDQLGHSGIGITADLYTHVRRARHDEAAERVAQLLFPTVDAGSGETSRS
jgi:integrase